MTIFDQPMAFGYISRQKYLNDLVNKICQYMVKNKETSITIDLSNSLTEDEASWVIEQVKKKLS